MSTVLLKNIWKAQFADHDLLLGKSVIKKLAGYFETHKHNKDEEKGVTEKKQKARNFAEKVEMTWLYELAEILKATVVKVKSDYCPKHDVKERSPCSN